VICPSGCFAIPLFSAPLPTLRLRGTDLPVVSSSLAKNSSLCRLVETAIEPLHPVPTKGRFAIVTDVGRDAVDAGIAPDERANPADGEVVWS
jgi:hypothetical protein